MPAELMPAGDQVGLAHLKGELERLDTGGLLRQPRLSPKNVLQLCSNDYLGYAAEPLSLSQAAGGAGASRLITGNHSAHEEAEKALASWLGCEAALLFSSGYAANVGVIAALAGPADLIISDALNHASIIDGCRLSRAQVVVVPHLDVTAVQRALSQAPGGRESDARRCFVVTESYFSMDGTSPDLVALRKLCDASGAALFVDDAHALGVFGPAGKGLCAAQGVSPDVLIGTLGKALGLQGAFVAGSTELRTWLWNRARSFVFSTGLSPVVAAAVGARVKKVEEDEVGRERLRHLSNYTRSVLSDAGLPVLASSHGPIVPILVGESEVAIQRSEWLLEQGVYVQAIRPPTVPVGSARLRVTLHSKLTNHQLDRGLASLVACWSKWPR